MVRDERIEMLKMGIGLTKSPDAIFFEEQRKSKAIVKKEKESSLPHLDVNGLRRFLENVQKAKSFIDPEVYAKKEIRKRKKELTWIKKNVLCELKEYAELQAPLLGYSWRVINPFMQSSTIKPYSDKEIEKLRDQLDKIEIGVIKRYEIEDETTKEIEKEEETKEEIFQEDWNYLVSEFYTEIKKDLPLTDHLFNKRKIKFFVKDNNNKSPKNQELFFSIEELFGVSKDEIIHKTIKVAKKKVLENKEGKKNKIINNIVKELWRTGEIKEEGEEEDYREQLIKKNIALLEKELGELKKIEDNKYSRRIKEKDQVVKHIIKEYKKEDDKSIKREKSLLEKLIELFS